MKVKTTGALNTTVVTTFDHWGRKLHFPNTFYNSYLCLYHIHPTVSHFFHIFDYIDTMCDRPFFIKCIQTDVCSCPTYSCTKLTITQIPIIYIVNVDMLYTCFKVFKSNKDEDLGLIVYKKYSKPKLLKRESYFITGKFFLVKYKEWRLRVFFFFWLYCKFEKCNSVSDKSDYWVC